MRHHTLSKLMSTRQGTLPCAQDQPARSTIAEEWGALMLAAQNGYGGAYRRLLNEISGWLHRYFQRRLPPGDVDDAVQKTLLAIHRRCHTFDPHYSLALCW